MFNKYLLIAIGVLFGGCVILYNLWDSTKAELNAMKIQNKILEQEINRRDENERKLSKRITELTELYSANADWASGIVPIDIRNKLSKSCKSCK